MNSTNFSRYALLVWASVSVLAACNSGGSQVAPLGSMQQRAAPFDMQKIQSTTVASVAHGAHRVTPDRIVYTPANVQIENSHYNLDLNNDKTTDFVISERNGSGSAPYCPSKTDYYQRLRLTGQGSNGVVLVNSYAARLVSGSSIGPSQSFSTRLSLMEFYVHDWKRGRNGCMGFSQKSGNWPVHASGYLGLAFVIGRKTHYGWAALTIPPRSGRLSATLTGYAYQTRAGKSIKAGQM